MIDGREILKYSRDMQRDRRTEKDNFCAGLSMHLARVRVLKLSIRHEIYRDQACT